MSRNAKIVLIVSISLLALVAATVAAIITLPLVKEAFEFWNMDRAYKANWGFELVKGTKPLYDAPTEPNFFGDGVRYSVFDISGVGNAKSAYSLKHGYDGEFERDVASLMSRRADENGGDVDALYALHFPDEYDYRKTVDNDDTLYIVAFGGRLYIIEDFM